MDTGAHLINLIRWLFGSTALKVNKDTINLLNEQYTEPTIQALRTVNGSGSSLAIQPITKAQLEAAQGAGGDAIDLSPSLGTFISMHAISPGR